MDVWSNEDLEMNEMRALRWMCGDTKKDTLWDEHV